MTPRPDHLQLAPDLFQAFARLSQQLKQSALAPQLIELVDIRASQLNGCTFCVDLHVKRARLHGERELRLHHVATWRDSPLFTARERAALAWTEAVTSLTGGHVADDVYVQVRAELSDRELVELTYVVMVINGWNRLNVAFRTPPGGLDTAFGLDKAGLSG
ncbi:carboxymuconolactone decarboxylase family protein [Stenotrophomonas sp. 24(2023)]|uniref:carboxymuconolactone decarboxylase family protein n=1 Tax=Stenotrophomonas sp. 24(2023) TaxID=3068324 RepID=UPI0027E1706B|nr:carboxymuconolactone decarboxylase family protein [Stenotrophomonas sp. 24(2023)]WMJ68244.1 carboxymuconolactone decarboxylase family protein [Stenotrophomonas sp. 24(2023)]